MSIRLEYIVCNHNGDELKRFDVKTEAEAYDSVICAAEDISLLLAPLQKKLALSDEQIYAVSEHLAFEADELKVALRQIKKPKAVVKASDEAINSDPILNENKDTAKKASKKK